ncbi:unnamed protein product [Didymodactylos carnosus]|uniref:Beta-1,4-galactosyltransferase n=1 Tax=Didymodactylos carnosus TaxID=1234261 RepID=A0A814U824_9BILA|nr:unnamed protein product [Didymodactylos carnosus]CAF1172956.1 unnamed protein product [Didymodactylos carnosus]CAF3936799.1 unnamed protein product [Didymodactylos carnosus]CAF3973175.1 unnamed protein product [Didymodactylos carnosus]
MFVRKNKFRLRKRRCLYPIILLLLIIIILLLLLVTFKRPSSSLPPFNSSANSENYLLIPYRDYVLRTPITCQQYKLDDYSKKNLLNFHPQHSKYLEGQFSYFLPFENITYENIEQFYAQTHKNYCLPMHTDYGSDIPFVNSIPYKYHSDMGLWEPIGVTSTHRIAILVPLKGRDFNAKTFLFNIHTFLRRQLSTYIIIYIEQINPIAVFNKGRLYNTAISYIKQQTKLEITCFILHDVDLIPENDGNYYTCESKHIKHTTVRIRLSNATKYLVNYEFLIGGVLMLSHDQYVTINGFSNLYWGWGGEDDDLGLRLIKKHLCVIRPSDEVATYVALYHAPTRPNNERFELLKWSTVRIMDDGYSSVNNLTRITDVQQTMVMTHLKVDVDVQRTVRPTSLKK